MPRFDQDPMGSAESAAQFTLLIIFLLGVAVGWLARGVVV